jgi:RHS repeat-associated protein
MRGRVGPGLGSGVVAALALVSALAVPARAHHVPAAPDPFDVVADGLGDVRGLVVDAEGSLFVADRAGGTVARIAPDGSKTVVASRLERPIGLALDALGRVLVAEERAGRVVRLEPNGMRTPLVAGVKQPRWLAVGDDGTVYIAARRLTRDGDPEPDDESAEPETVLRLTAAGGLTVFADGFKKLQGLALGPDGLFVATQGLRRDTQVDGVVFLVPIIADGSAGPPLRHGPGDQFKKPVGLARDRLGALYLTTRELGLVEDHARRAVAKLHADGRVTAFAANLHQPQGAAFDRHGDLFVADGDSGRVLRFRAPPPPEVTAPLVTRHSPLTVTGLTLAGARVDAFVEDGTAVFSVLAGSTGAFGTPVALRPNATTALELFATTRGGLGLTSAPGAHTLTHDAIAPGLGFEAPPPGAHVRGLVTVRAQASDAGSAVASLTLTIDGQPLPADLTPAPPAVTLGASASWDTLAAADGAHSLGATALDGAGNPASLTRVAVVDNTPPDTVLVGGPAGEHDGTAATFAFTGHDDLTPLAGLTFAWRLDGGPWSAFAGATVASVDGLADGTHTFEVKARDLAGNEDPTPARHAFTVRSGPRVTAVTPASGAPGTFVTITGAGFEPGATAVTFNGVPAAVRTLTPERIGTTVPVGATTGRLMVATPRGTADAAFGVTLTGDVTLTVAPAPPSTLRVIAGDHGFASVVAGGGGSFTSLTALSSSRPPAGVTTAFAPGLLAPGGTSILHVAVAADVAPGAYGLTVHGLTHTDGLEVRRTAEVVLEVLPPTTAAVTGRVLTADPVPEPIAGATITLGSAFALTDAGGNFVLLAAPPGAAMLVVDGRTASTADSQFPLVEVQVDVSAVGPTRVPFVLYLPRLDTAHPIDLPIDPSGAVTRTVEATTPRIPGLVVTIPQGTRIIGPDGQPVRQLTITPVPVDRSPMPFPPGVAPPMLFAIQPGGAVPSQPLPVTFPNPRLAGPGTGADLYYFDLVAGNWDVWGRGTVTPGGDRIASDPGAGLPRLAWHFPCADDCLGPPDDAPPAANQPAPKDGDPVDLFTGRFVAHATDFALPARVPVRIERAYWSGLGRRGPFGPGWSLMTYDARLVGSGASLVLVQSDQSRLLFVPDGAGRWTTRGAPAMAGAVLAERPGEFRFDLRLRDGTVHRFERIVGFANVAALAAIVDRNGNAVTITREVASPQTFGRIVRITEAAGRAFALAYDAADRITAVTDPLGRVVRYGYDAEGRLATVTDPAGGVTRYGYDAAHRLVEIIDPRGTVTITNEYDASGRVVGQVRADGGIWRYAYAANGGVTVETTATDPDGHVTIHRFDPGGFRIATTDALGQVTTSEYAPGSNLLRASTDALGRTARYDHDADGNVVRVTDAAGATRSYTYEPVFGQVTSVTDELGATTRFDYDAAGNLVASVDPLGHRTTLTRDAYGQVTAISDPLGGVTTFAHDADGNRTAITNPLGDVVRREYDAVGRLVARVDPLGARTAFFYDPLDRITGIVDAAGGLTTFTYDSAGNLLDVEDPQGNVTVHTYDTMNRLATRRDPGGRTETFAYDGRDNLIAATDRTGRLRTYRYDALSRLVGVAHADGTRVRFDYDAVGDLIEAVDSASGAIVLRHDARGLLVAETTDRGTVAHRYDAAGRPVETTVAGQAPVTYVWDPASRLIGVAQGPAVVEIGYDAAGRRTRVVAPNLVATEYAYDAAARVTALLYRSPQGLLGDLRYGYDPAGRRTSAHGSFARTLLPQAVAQAAYAAGNRQVQFGDAVMTHDGNGNLTTLADPEGTTTYGWDARDRLVAVSGPARHDRFTYDAFGRRIRRDTGGAVVDYLHDGADVVQESRDGQAIAYVRAPWPDEPFARSTGEFYALTGAGSVLALTDEGGAAATVYAYDPFGNAAALGAPTTNPFTYAGREDDGGGLYFYRARYYAPRLHRFLSEDPSGFAGGDPNLYAYVHNSPVSLVDPLGRDATIWWPPGPGRSFFWGPRNGNWGGAKWWGGRGPRSNGPLLPPVDSGDECYMGHDLCWGDCEACQGKRLRCMRQCDRLLVRCLRDLPNDPTQWPRPPRPGTERDSSLFREKAIRAFRDFSVWN